MVVRDRDGCWWCGGQLIWQGDHDKEDVMGVEGIITHLVCSSCDAFVEYTSTDEEEEEEEEGSNKK